MPRKTTSGQVRLTTKRKKTNRVTAFVTKNTFLAFLIVFAIGGVAWLLVSRAAPAPAYFSINDCPSKSGTTGLSCGDALNKKVFWLQAGQTLYIAPGTYEVGSMGFNLRNDSDTSARITITAQDPNNQPLMRGRVQLWHAKNVTVSKMRFQAVLPGDSALATVCGVNWRVEDSHIFGAQQTESYSNMTIAGNNHDPSSGTYCPNEPRGFVVRNNLFTDPFTDPNLVPLEECLVCHHHIYTTFGGTANTNGIIERNVFVGNHNGSGVKLGTVQELEGPRNVQVRFNTFYDGVYGVLFAWNTRSNLAEGNLIVKMDGPYRYTGAMFAYGGLPDTTNEVRHNYGHGVAAVGEELVDNAELTIGIDNDIRDDPQLNFSFPDFLKPANPQAAAYGKYGTGAFPTPPPTK